MDLRTRRHAPKSHACSRVRSSVAPLLLALGLAVAAQLGLARNAHPAESYDAAAHLTGTLQTLTILHRGAAVDEQARLSGDLLSVAARRHQLLSAIIQDDPGAVLRAAMPAELRASLPPAVQAYVEEEMDVEGELEVLHEDRDDDSRYLYFVKVKEERFSLHFAAHPPALQTGSRVRIRGIRVERALALESGSTSVESLSSVLPNSFGEQRTVVILVNFQDKPTEQPYTRDYARDVVLGTANQFYAEASYHQTSLAGDVFGWLTIPMNSTVCDSWALADHAKAAATAAGVNLSAYTRYVFAFPGNACTWWGTGTVGGNPSQAWINGTLVFQVVGHEMGHNFGLFHSRALDCGATTLGANCTTEEYGDTLDVMGWSTGHYNAFQKERLGWLNHGISPPITTVQADGTYSLDPYESIGGNAKALKILKDTDPTSGKKTWYYVEFRQGIGFDGFLSGNSNVLNGVVIHTGSELSDNSSDLLDMTPSTASSSDPALAIGQSFNDPDAEVTIEAAWASSTGASVRVTFGTPTCVPSNPTVALSPSQSQSVKAGTPVTYTLSVTNNDSAACAPSSFTLQPTAPTGWSSTFASSSLAASPGAQVSTTLRVTSPSSATGGAYPIGATARTNGNAGFSASASATYQVAVAPTCVPSNPTVALSPSQSQSVPAGVSVNYTVSVTNNDSIACPASSFTLQATAPTGWSAVFTSTLALSPGVGVSTRLQITSPVSATPGIYPIGVTAGSSAGAGFSASASTTLKVAGPLTVGLSTTQSSYVRGQSVFVTANVSDNGLPISRAKVTFSVTKPNGIVVTKTISTKTDGAAIYKFRLGSSSPIGAYQVRGDANLKNVRFGSAATSFTVQ